MNSGSTYTFTITPNSGYYINTIQGCNGTAFTGNSTNTTARTFATGAITSACTVSATFAQVSPSSFTGGAVTIGGAASPGYYLTTSVSGFSPTPDSYTYQWQRNGANIVDATASTYLLTTADAGQSISLAVTANKTGYIAKTVISNTITVNLYSVSTRATAGGSISSPALVNSGATYTLTITPDAGYYISTISGCGGTTFTGNSTNTAARTYTTGPITGNCAVSATFSPLPITISGSAGTGGSISPSSAQVNSGSAYTFTITPNSGYYISSISGCNGTQFTGNSTNTAARTFTTGAITSACTVSVTFAPVYITISGSAGTGGAIFPSGTITGVVSGTTRTFTVMPSSGYYISSISGCGGTTVTGDSTYTEYFDYVTGAITTACTVSATFSDMPIVTVKTSASTGGTISPSSAQVKTSMATLFAVTPDAGYYIRSISGCGGALLTDENTTVRTYITGGIASACTVTVLFGQLPVTTYGISTSSNIGGSISPPVLVNLGATYTLTITPGAGYYIHSISGCGGATVFGNSTYTAARTYTTGPITDACTVWATFAKL
ncbi:MAG: hypothetical protein FWC42_06535 [Proteobacteria bacterium]|nr:hypothetical protein [Pseudomonadota bacterium]